MKLCVKDVHKTFFNNGRQKVKTLEGINLEIESGEFICIVGPSGCGKSTLLNIIAGLESSTSGEILLNGKKVNKPSPDRVLMFQESALFPWLNVVKNIEFGLEMIGIKKCQRRAIARHFLKMVNLQGYENCYIHQLSGGMKQRIALARSLALDSEVLLMDEPFAALDNETRSLLHNELLQIWQKTKKTIIFVTHHVEEAVILADRIIVMTSNPGTIKAEVKINHSRPRNLDNIALKRLVEEVKKNMKQNDTKLKEEPDFEWIPAESNILYSPGHSVGRGF